MFTGLIENVGRVRALQRTSGKLRLQIETSLPVEEVALGDSVAVDGCCLTVVESGAGLLGFDAADESLRRTTLGERRSGDLVHLERALKVGSRLDGHIVQGHVDGVGRLRSRSPDGDAVILTIEVPKPLLRYMVEKGGVALDGTSLTLTALSESTCSVMLIPFSQQKTHLAKKPVGSGINIEVDVLAKYVEKLMQKKLMQKEPGGLDLRALEENGFI